MKLAKQPILIAFIITLSLFVSVGCSPSKAISDAATEAKNKTTQSTKKLDKAVTELTEAEKTVADIKKLVKDVDPVKKAKIEPKVDKVEKNIVTSKNEVISAKKDVADIDKIADEIHSKVTQVEDVVPWWANTIVWVVGGAALIAFLWYFGAPIKRVLMIIIPTPKPTSSAAALLAKGKTSEAISVLRSSDPKFEKEYKNTKDKITINTNKNQENNSGD